MHARLLVPDRAPPGALMVLPRQDEERGRSVAARSHLLRAVGSPYRASQLAPLEWRAPGESTGLHMHEGPR